MLVNYPDYFAAAYPCCEAYAFYEYERNKDGTYKADSKAEASNQALDTPGTRWMTEEKIEILKNIPMWFTVSIDDPVVIPEAYVLPTYQALLQAGCPPRIESTICTSHHISIIHNFSKSM